MKKGLPAPTCRKCGIGLGRDYADDLCPPCRGEQDEMDTEARLAAGGA